MKECPPEETQISREVLAHLSGLAGGEDTMDGIARKLLPAMPTTRQGILLKEVLGDLVTQGRIEKLVRDERIRYRLRSRL